MVRWLLLALLTCGAAAYGAVAACHGESAYDFTVPTGLFHSWNSTSGASGRIEFAYGVAGSAVPAETQEAGLPGIRRRVVLAPGNNDCKTLPDVTTSHRGQQAGVPFNNSFILYLAFKSRPCIWMDGLTIPGAKAGAAGVLWMVSGSNVRARARGSDMHRPCACVTPPPPQYSDEKPEDDGRIVPYSWHLNSKVQIS
jgi:hypothetical protein